MHYECESCKLDELTDELLFFKLLKGICKTGINPNIYKTINSKKKKYNIYLIFDFFQLWVVQINPMLNISPNHTTSYFFANSYTVSPIAYCPHSCNISHNKLATNIFALFVYRIWVSLNMYWTIIKLFLFRSIYRIESSTVVDYLIFYTVENFWELIQYYWLPIECIKICNHQFLQR